ncbi:MAG: 2Fe-2S iron-sulfur cluster-binding protein, partial [Gaiellaceae bacterium]
MRLERQPHELIDRTRAVTFRFGGQTVQAFEGDTIGSALYASGRRVFSRSFKYHRPRGLLCCAGQCANCLMSVDGVPNVRVCAEPVREGAVVAGQNALGSIDRDLLSVIDRAGGPFTPVGFYYRTMIRPRRAWPLYEKALRSLAGLGKVGGEQRRYDKEHRRARVLVIGGGRSGREAALAAAAEGPGVVLVDESARPLELPGVEVIAPGRALSIYEGGLVPVDAGTLLLRFRAGRIVVATGTIEQPLVFPGNDLVGVLLPGAVRRLVGDWAVKPGERAVVIGGDDAVDPLERAGVEIAEVADPASLRSISARGSNGRLVSVELDGKTVECDLAIVSGGRQPAYSLLAQAGARVEYDPARRVFVPTELPAGIEAVGSVFGGGSTAAPSYRGDGAKGRCFVCVCEDVTEKDVDRAIREGFDSIELSKR